MTVLQHVILSCIKVELKDQLGEIAAFTRKEIHEIKHSYVSSLRQLIPSLFKTH